MIGTIVGIEIRKYTKGDELKTARTAYVVWDKPKNAVEGLSGQRCEALYVPFEIPRNVYVNTRCELTYEIYSGAKGQMARLVDITPCKN